MRFLETDKTLNQYKMLKIVLVFVNLAVVSFAGNSSGSENCFQLKIQTKVYAWENNWSLGTCGSNREYISNVDYTETCCLDPGQYHLRCNDNGQDGWHGGFIEIQGTRYCQDFTNGKERVQIINITAAQDSYALIANTQCFGTYGPAYTSLVRAKTNCDQDPLCTMVSDPHCEGYRYRTCRGSSGDSTRGSCVWMKKLEGSDSPKLASSDHHAQNIIAQASCVGLSNTAGWVFAVRRACNVAYNYMYNYDCSTICMSAALKRQDSEISERNGTCLNAIRVYPNRPSITGPVILGPKVYRYNSCGGHDCGPNFCCCHFT